MSRSAADGPSDFLLIALTAVAASTDAISYLGFGSVFPANMTGNTVLLGIGVASADDAGAIRSLVALGAFLLGAVLAGVTLVGRPWPLMISVAVTVELGLLAAAGVWWLAAGHGLSAATRCGLIGLVSTAMGVQSAAVSNLHVGVSTTYITGTWTSVSMWAASLARLVPRTSLSSANQNGRHARQATVVVTYLCAALGSAWLERVIDALALALPVGVLACLALARPGHRAAKQDRQFWAFS